MKVPLYTANIPGLSKSVQKKTFNSIHHFQHKTLATQVIPVAMAIRIQCWPSPPTTNPLGVSLSPTSLNPHLSPSSLEEEEELAEQLSNNNNNNTRTPTTQAQITAVTPI